MLTEFVYVCKYMDRSSELDWHSLQGMSLKETASGDDVPMNVATEVKACWSSEYLHIRYICEDAYVKSEYTNRDDPLYEADVVEVFIDEEGNGTRYLEIEVSPRNVVFDAVVHNDLNGSFTADTAWNAYAMRTQVEKVSGPRGQQLIYSLDIPLSEFDRKPLPGVEWRINFYRIDEDVQGKRTYMAWSPTGEINFHKPQYFGRLVFE